jgi:Ca2+-binding EF-hand superfamily protein
LTKFLSALDTLNIEFEREDLTAMFGMFDLDNDGSIEIEEFIAVIEGDHSHEDLDVL